MLINANLFYTKYSKTINIVKYYCNFKQLFLCEYVLNCNLFLYFQHHYSSLQCHMIFRNHNNIKKHF